MALNFYVGLFVLIELKFGRKRRAISALLLLIIGIALISYGLDLAGV